MCSNTQGMENQKNFFREINNIFRKLPKNSDRKKQDKQKLCDWEIADKNRGRGKGNVMVLRPRHRMFYWKTFGKAVRAVRKKERFYHNYTTVRSDGRLDNAVRPY